jgi:hypothetical protein
MRQNGTELQALSCRAKLATGSSVVTGTQGRMLVVAVDLLGPTAYVDGERPGIRHISHMGETMSGFDDRQKGQEAKFAFDSEKKFKAEARRNKLLGIWAAELMSLSGDEAKAYAAEVVAADFEEAGDEDVFRKVSGDLKAKGVSIGDDVIRQKMATLVAVANEQIASEG